MVVRKVMRSSAQKTREIAADQRGAAAIEFAIVSSFLLLLLMGIIEFGLAIFNYNRVQDAARYGARSMVLSQTTATGLSSYIKTEYPFLTNATIQSTDVNNVVTVTVETPVSDISFVAYFSNILNFSLTARAAMPRAS